MTPEHHKRVEEVQLLTAFLNLKLSSIDVPELELDKSTYQEELGLIATKFGSSESGNQVAAIELHGRNAPSITQDWTRESIDLKFMINAENNCIHFEIYLDGAYEM